ncbi:AraC-type DNA-binding protein [Chryseolinea serpens]|uniref:AraC-type DNA-binding protein n=1 Tax=Chryseolinea serpens TaxID=947013 RepID=A0A1M5XAS9_9BACT|nr:helix-turn-helix domain-containing protein [Chryseolinea serpens]SHH96911.1 AraC-type DNA-binding protein [Chryseolinea serpens]
MKTFFSLLFQVLIYGGIIQSVFIVLLLNNKGVRKGRANIFLSVLLLALAFSISHILFAGVVLDHLSARVYSIGDPTFYLIAPLLWFYACELTGLRIRFSWTSPFHFAPFFIIIFLSLSLHELPDGHLSQFLAGNHRLVTIFFWITVVTQFSWYLALVRKRWLAYQQFMEQEVSNTENVSISWLRFFMAVFLAINLLFLFSLFAAIHFQPNVWLQKATALTFSLSIFALGYKGILQKEIFQPEGRTDDKSRTIIPPAKEKPDQALIDQVTTYMEEQKPYLDPELTLTSLAKGLNMTRSQLSQLINVGFGDNFYDFVNKYRVEQVKRLMTDPHVKNFNMLGIALEAGFKSKSTFNLIFKRFTGLTPTEYRKNLLD